MLLLGLTWVRFCLCCWLRFAWAPMRRTRTTVTTRLLPTPRPRRSSHQPPSESRAVVEQPRVSNALAEKHRDWSKEQWRLGSRTRREYLVRLPCFRCCFSWSVPFPPIPLPSHSHLVPSRPVALRFSHFSVVLAVKGCSFDCSAASCIVSCPASVRSARQELRVHASMHDLPTFVFLLKRCT